MIGHVIVAHPDRHNWAGELAARLEAWISLDSERLGAGANHRRALQHGLGYGWDHIVVLEDDAVLTDDYEDSLGRAIEQRPDQIIGLYVGRQRPHAKAVANAVMQADMQGASWLTHHGLLWGVATVWPRALAEAWLIEPESGVWDSHVRRWCRREGHEVAYTWPSLVDHRDEPSVVARTAQRPAGRTAWRTGVPSFNGVSVTL